jgi:hypothetical protein
LSAGADLERDVVQECRVIAAAMGVFLAEVGQRRAKGSGTTVGYPDLTLLCAGQVVLVEVKRPRTADHPRGYLSLGQSAFIARALEMGVDVRVVETPYDFIAIVNHCRRSRGVKRRARP